LIDYARLAAEAFERAAAANNEEQAAALRAEGYSYVRLIQAQELRGLEQDRGDGRRT
jgi:hypothetical protein